MIPMCSQHPYLSFKKDWGEFLCPYPISLREEENTKEIRKIAKVRRVKKNERKNHI